MAAAVFFVLALTGNAQDENAQDENMDYFNRGVVNYIRGDLPQAVENLQKAYSQNPDDTKIQTFYLKTLVETGTQLYERGEYEQAKPHFEKALQLSPENKEVEKMYSIITDSEKRDVAMTPALESFRKEQEKLISGYLKQKDVFDKIIAKLDTERDSLKKIIKEREETIKNDIIRFVIIAAITAFIAGILLLGILFLWYRKKEGLKTDALLSHQESIIKKMQSFSAASDRTASDSASFKIDSSERGVITDINTSIRKRAKRVEMLEKDLRDEKDPEVAEKLLQQYINDDNNRIKANAAKALYPHNSQKALEILAEMLLNYDKWMRTSAVWALGEISTEKAAKLLLSLKNEDDPNVKAQLTENIEKLMDNKELSQDTMDNLVERLKKLKEGQS